MSGDGLAPELLTYNFVIGCTMLIRSETAKATLHPVLTSFTISIRMSRLRSVWHLFRIVRYGIFVKKERSAYESIVCGSEG